MTWVRKDDQMPIHRKVAPLSDTAYRLLDEAICWSSRNLTDGVIAADELNGISKRGRPAVAAELVRRRLWHEAGHDCPSEYCPPPGPDGWVIHDYWEYQPSREQVEAERAAKAERMRNWREAKKRRSSASSTSRSSATDAPRDTLVDPPVTPTPSPPPPRPEGRAGTTSPPASAVRRQAADAAAGGREEDHKPVGGRPPSNGRPAAPPPADLLAEARAQLTAASRKQRASVRRRERSALDELRAATPDIPIPTAPEETQHVDPPAA